MKEGKVINKVDNKKNVTSNQKKKISKQSNKNKVIGKTKKVRKQAKKFFGLIFVFTLFILLLCSPIFNIKSIEIEGNSQISDEKIISFSLLQLNTNIFKFNKGLVKKNIEENAYIESVEITRKIPSVVQIKVKERIPTYMLQFADSYVYINNQGYMLEISNEKLDIPILIGFTTDLSNIKAGNRINVNDLKKMDMVIKIYEATKSSDLEKLVSKIDISNSANYTMILEEKGIKVYLGDCSDLNTKILYLKSIMETLDGKTGELFLNVDLNVQNAYFRPNSN